MRISTRRTFWLRSQLRAATDFACSRHDRHCRETVPSCRSADLHGVLGEKLRQSVAFGGVEHFTQPSSELSRHAEHAPPIALRLAHDPGELHRYRGARCRNENPVSPEAWIGSVQSSN